MKIKSEHRNTIKERFNYYSNLIKEHKKSLQSPENPRKPKDLNKRLRWDALHSLFGSTWICENLYPYLNDDHIDTALRRIMEELKIN